MRKDFVVVSNGDVEFDVMRNGRSDDMILNEVESSLWGMIGPWNIVDRWHIELEW